jgi:hypothetical protein
MSEAWEVRLRALSTDTRIDKRSHIHAYVQCSTSSDATPLWILHATNSRGSQMHILEHWLSVWMAPHVGVLGKTTYVEWNHSPLVLPNEAFHRADAPCGGEWLLTHTPLQALVRSFWQSVAERRVYKMASHDASAATHHESSSSHAASAADTAAAAAAANVTNIVAPAASSHNTHAPTFSDTQRQFMRTCIDMFASTLPLPDDTDGSDIPTLSLRQVRFAPDQVCLYDCWHVMCPPRTEPARQCVQNADASECLSDISCVLAHSNDFDADERHAYAACVSDILQVALPECVKRALHGLPLREEGVTLQDKQAFDTRGYVIVRHAAPLPSCPCGDLQTWMLHTVPVVLPLMASLYHHMHAHATENYTALWVVPIDSPDVRLRVCSATSPLTCYISHQPPQDIVLPVHDSVHPNKRDYHAYRSLSHANDDDVLQSFNTLSIECEQDLIDAMLQESDKTVRRRQRRTVASATTSRATAHTASTGAPLALLTERPASKRAKK